MLKNFIEKTKSQALQDIFAIYINQYSNSGYFLDLGCNEPIINNNTALLEKMGWSGLLADYVPQLVNNCSLVRKNPVICADLVNTSISDILKQYNAPKVIDYISLDLDSGAALPCIKNFDFDSFEIKCMTFEHDSYQHGPKMRDDSRIFLNTHGLEVVCEDVTIFNGKSFEDWYVNPRLVNSDIINKIKCSNKEYSSIFNHLL